MVGSVCSCFKEISIPFKTNPSCFLMLRFIEFDIELCTLTEVVHLPLSLPVVSVLPLGS